MDGRKNRNRWGWLGLVVGILLGLESGTVYAVFLDPEETLRFNGQVYNRTAMAVQSASDNTRLQTPYNDWNMLQNRTFIQAELRHDLTDLIAGRATGFLSPLQAFFAPLRALKIDSLGYFVTYRGEYDGVWDYGPDVFSERSPLLTDCGVPTKAKHKRPLSFEGCSRSDPRGRLRHRHRLFEAYVNYTSGPLFLRIGRQNLSWGETDVFRLLDQINPLDASFGGFLVPLDQRRVPLDMARLVYGFGGGLDRCLNSTLRASWCSMTKSPRQSRRVPHGQRLTLWAFPASSKSRQRILPTPVAGPGSLGSGTSLCSAWSTT